MFQEQAELKLRAGELKQREESVTRQKEGLERERAELERQRAELEREKERLSGLALTLKTRAQEVEAFSKVCTDTKTYTAVSIDCGLAERLCSIDCTLPSRLL